MDIVQLKEGLETHPSGSDLENLSKLTPFNEFLFPFLLIQNSLLNYNAPLLLPISKSVRK